MKSILFLFVFALISCNPAEEEKNSSPSKIVNGTGTIQYTKQSIEFAGYSLIVNEEELKDTYLYNDVQGYEVNDSLPDEFKEDGLEVKFTGRVIEPTGAIYGGQLPVLEILDIEELD